MQNPTFGKPSVDYMAKTAPEKVVALTSAPQSTHPQTGDLSPESPDACKITRNSMVVHETLYNRPKPSSQLGDGLMTSPHERLLHLLQLAAKPLSHGLTLDGEAFPLAGRRTDMSKPKEIKSLGLSLTTLRSVRSSKTPKLDQPSLFGVQTETEFTHALCELPKKPFCLFPVLKPHDEIIGIANDDHVASGMSPAPLLYPKVQYVVQVDVGEQRRNHGPLGSPQLRLRPDAFFHDSGLEPLLYQAQDPSVGNPVFQKLHQPSVLDSVEKAPDVCVEHPVDLPLRDPDIKSIQRMMCAAPGTKSVGETQKVDFIDGIEDTHQGLLDNLIFQSRDPQGSEFAVPFGDIGPPGRLSPVGPAMNTLMKVHQAALQTIFVLLPGHSIHPWRCFPLECMKAVPQEINRNVVQ